MTAIDSDNALPTLDGFASILFVFMVLTGLMFTQFDTALIVVAIVFPAIWYIIAVVVDPLRQSEPLDHPEIAAILGNERRTYLRVSTTTDTCAIDLWACKFIIFNAEDLTKPYQNWKAMIGHELAHLRHGDSKYFHFAGLSGLAAAAMAFYIGFVMVLVGPNPDNYPTVASQTWPFYVIPYGIAIVLIFFVFWIRSSVHRREFRADAASRAFDQAAFDEWLDAQVMIEAETRFPILETPARLLRWFTHPSFQRRFARATAGSTSPSLLPEIARAFLFFCGSAALTGFVGFGFSNLNLESISYPVSLLPVAIAAMAVVVIMPMAAGVGIISVSTMTVLDAKGLKIGAAFVFTLSLSIAVLLNFGTLLLQATGAYETITVDLPPSPAAEASSFGYELLSGLIIMSNFALIVLAMNHVLRRLLPGKRFKLVPHLIVGFVAPVGMFLLTKLQWWLFA